MTLNKPVTLNSRLDRRTLKWIIVVVIALAALLLRVYAIDRLPPGLFGDEAVEGLDALDVLAGNFAIWFHAHLGREPLYVYLVAVAYQFLGVTPLATRLPALMAGLLTIPATFWFALEWALQYWPPERAKRLALLTSALLTISFWHIQMTRDAHRDTLLPLVEAVGCALLWRGIRTKNWKMYAAAGAVLGLAVYTYSPGRFVGVFITLFFAVELLIRLWGKRKALDWQWRGLMAAGGLAVVVMLPLGIYFAQNPVQFSRRFESVSVLDAGSPPAALAESVFGNLAQLVVPGAGYQSKHYNLPGKPIFDLFIAPWFLVGLMIALTRTGQSTYRFLLFWFVVMLVPAFLTADMIPKAVRALGVVPGVFLFPALAMDWAWERVSGLGRQKSAILALVVLSFIGSAVWTAYDYFNAWANLPELPLAFDADMAELSDFILHQPADQVIYISSLVYRPPTEMLLGRHVATSRYLERATRIREFDATSALVTNPRNANPIYVWVREQTPPEVWLARLAPGTAPAGEGEYYATVHLGPLAPPEEQVEVPFNPLLKLVGYTLYSDEPRGIALYWRVVQLPADRDDIQATVIGLDTVGKPVTQGQHRFGVPPLEWVEGDTIVEWYPLDAQVAQFAIQLQRGTQTWQSPPIAVK